MWAAWIIDVYLWLEALLEVIKSGSWKASTRVVSDAKMQSFYISSNKYNIERSDLSSLSVFLVCFLCRLMLELTPIILAVIILVFLYFYTNSGAGFSKEHSQGMPFWSWQTETRRGRKADDDRGEEGRRWRTTLIELSHSQETYKRGLPTHHKQPANQSTHIFDPSSLIQLLHHSSGKEMWDNLTVDETANYLHCKM